MKLEDLGEFGLIQRIERAARKLRHTHRVVVGIGDDAAVLRVRDGEDVLSSTDAMVEDVHFRWRTESARHIGRRALVANLSDLAAMGARPLGFTAALAAPGGLPVKVVDELLAGLLLEADRHACPLVGGNVTRAPSTSLTLSVLGVVSRGRLMRRGRAAAGDRILVTGRLGAAALARARAESGAGRIRHTPVPRLTAGYRLAGLPGLRGCIDISDGLAADCSHLLASDRLEARLDVTAVPRPRGFAAACAGLGVEPESLLLAGGEDYELLFTLRGSRPSAASLGERLGVPVTEIGRVVRAGNRRPSGADGGWRHF